MRTFRTVVPLATVLLSLLTLSGCGGDSDASSTVDESVLSIPDPAQPVAADVTIGGSFSGEPTTAPEDLEPENPKAIVFRDADTNDLSPEEIDQAPDFDLETFATAFDSVEKSQPTLSQTSTEFARAIIAEIRRISPQADVKAVPMKSSILDTFSSLTSAEKMLVLQNPIKAIKTRTATNEALAATGLHFTGSFYLTRADAFRHSYWNWLMSNCCGVPWATAFATAHESAIPNNDDKRMDLNNNMIGRRLFSSSPNLTPADAQTELLNYKLLWVNSKQKNVTVGIDYLVYLEPMQTLTVFDDGPEYDDIYIVSVDGKVLGETPQGKSREFEFDQMPSGTHALDIYCKVDGTLGGCGFQIKFVGASTLPGGKNNTSQIIIQQGQTHSTSFTFPTMQSARIN